jgi:hypothetical protein
MDFLALFKILFSLLSVLITLQAFAIPVYQSPDSPFSTADMHPRALRPDSQVSTKSWIHTESGWIPRDSVVRDIDLSLKAILTHETSLRSKPDSTTASQSSLHAKTRVEILERIDNWVKIKTETAHGWVSEETLESDPYDRGLVITKKMVQSFIYPKNGSRKSVLIPVGFKLKPLAVHNSWISIKYLNQPGWIPFEDVLSKLDFVLRVQPRGENEAWRVALENAGAGHKYQPLGPWIRVGVTEWLGLNQIKAIQTDPRKIVIAKKEITPRSLPSLAGTLKNKKYHFGEKIALGLPTLISWFHMTSSEGSIWWPVYPAGALDQKTRQDELTTAQLFSRRIYDLAENPVVSHFKIAASHGIYKTNDERTWKRIGFFGNKNFPIAFSPKGEIFVGGYRSPDGGVTFNPYLRWDRVLARLAQKQAFAPQNLRLTKIEFKEHKPGLFITVNIASHKLEGRQHSQNNFILNSTDGGLHWIDVPEKRTQRFDFAHGLSMNAE